MDWQALCGAGKSHALASNARRNATAVHRDAGIALNNTRNRFTPTSRVSISMRRSEWHKGPLLLQHGFQGLPEVTQASLAEPLCMDKHRALFRPSMMVHGGMERVHVLFKVLRVGNSHVLTNVIHSRIEDVVLDVFVNLQFEGEGAHQVPAPRVMGRCCFDCLEQPADQLMVLDQYLVGLLAEACTPRLHGC